MTNQDSAQDNPNDKDVQLSDLGEYAIHLLLRKRLEISGILGDPLCDDGAEIPIDRNQRAICVSTDFAPKGLSESMLGRFLVIQNVSDVMCSGAMPFALLIGLQIPRKLRVEHLEKILVGIEQEAKSYGVKVYGGDTKEADTLGGYGVCIGYQIACPKWGRKGASIGDVLVITQAGGRGLGWRWSYKLWTTFKLNLPAALIRQLEARWEDIILPSNTLTALQRSQYVRAAMDVSDGLGAVATAMTQDKSTGLVLNTASLEHILAPELRIISAQLQCPFFKLALSPGYDWQTALVIRPNEVEAVSRLAKQVGDKIEPIGRFVDSPGVFLEFPNGDISRIQPECDEKFKPYDWESKADAWGAWKL
jgi:thiamine-monophosphate kinase